MGGSKAYPYGSTTAMRGDVLAVLGVLKVATAGQIQRLARPAARDNKVARNALLDLLKHGLVVSEGSTQAAEKLWGLTPSGLAAAAEVLPDVVELGGIARGAGRSGAPHAMAVNETVIALLRPPAVVDDGQEHDDVPAGLGDGITAVATEVTHHLPAAGRNRSAVRTDAVLRAPEAGLPVLLLEVDRGTESPQRVADKFELYRRWFRLKTTSGDLPVWRTLYPATGREGYPPIALIYTGRPGPRALHNRLQAVAELTREHWAGRRVMPDGYLGTRGGYTEFHDAIPILAATLADLQAHGPRAPVWHRHGHPGGPQLLDDALDNPDDEAAWRIRDDAHRRRREAARLREEELRRQQRQATPDPWADSAPAPPPPPAAACAICNHEFFPPQPVDGHESASDDDSARYCPDCHADGLVPRPRRRRRLFNRG